MHFIIPGNSFTYVFYLYLYYTILIRLTLSLAIVTGCIIFWNYSRIHAIINSKEYPEIREKLWKEAFWSQSFCLLTAGGAPVEVIRQYIETQGEKKH